MSRILWLGDAGCTTGFGQVTHAIGDRLVNDYGHDVHVLAVNFDGDAGSWPTPMKLYLPTKLRPQDIYGQSRYVELLATVMPDIVVYLQDPFPILKFLLRNQYDTEMLMARTAPILAYLPVDGTNQPLTWARIPDIVASLPPVTPTAAQPSLRIVLMSEHGKTLYPDAPVVYHGVEESWRPIGKDPIVLSNGIKIASKGDAKEAFGIPRDAVLALRVDRNSNRKNFGETWKALVPVMRRHSDLHAWFHCKVEGDYLELPQIIARDPETAAQFHWPGNYSTRGGWKPEDLLALYNAGDMFVSTSMGEGFGLTLAEALACGLPVIAQNVSSIPEVVGPGGILLEPERLFTVASGEDQWLPNIPAFSAAIEKLYQSRGARRDLGDKGRAHVRASFSWDEAARRFDQLITEVTNATSGS